MNDIDIEKLQGIANQLRIHSIEATTAAGSGHPTSCCSAADIVAALFFGHMRYNPKDPHYYNNDRFILSKGHAAPLLYAAWAETGLFPASDLLKLRQRPEFFFHILDNLRRGARFLLARPRQFPQTTDLPRQLRRVPADQA